MSLHHPPCLWQQEDGCFSLTRLCSSLSCWEQVSLLRFSSSVSLSALPGRLLGDGWIFPAQTPNIPLLHTFLSRTSTDILFQRPHLSVPKPFLQVFPLVDVRLLTPKFTNVRIQNTRKCQLHKA